MRGKCRQLFLAACQGRFDFSMGFGGAGRSSQSASLSVLVNYAAAPATRPTPPLCRLAGVPRRLYSMLQTPGLVSVARAALVFVLLKRKSSSFPRSLSSGSLLSCFLCDDEASLVVNSQVAGKTKIACPRVCFNKKTSVHKATPHVGMKAPFSKCKAHIYTDSSQNTKSWRRQASGRSPALQHCYCLSTLTYILSLQQHTIHRQGRQAAKGKTSKARAGARCSNKRWTKHSRRQRRQESSISAASSRLPRRPPQQHVSPTFAA